MSRFRDADEELAAIIEKVERKGVELTLDQELRLAQIRALVEIAEELSRLNRGGRD